jgi:hypothetical protein
MILGKGPRLAARPLAEDEDGIEAVEGIGE